MQDTKFGLPDFEMSIIIYSGYLTYKVEELMCCCAPLFLLWLWVLFRNEKSGVGFCGI